MATQVTLPDLGENIESGLVVNLLVEEGDVIEKDQSIFELETDKATVEVPSSAAGKVVTINVRPGETVNIGAVVIEVDESAAGGETKAIETTGEAKVEPAAEQEPEAAAQPAPEPEKKEGVATAPTQAPTKETLSLPEPSAEIVPAAPSVRRLAREIGIPIAQVPGTGPGGRISEDDVKAFAKRLNEERQAAPVGAQKPLPDFTRWGDVEREAMSTIRRKTAEHMAHCWATIPHVHQFDKADITDVEAWRKRAGKRVEEAGGKLTITAIALKVAAAALKTFPKFNASIDMGSNEIIYKRYVNIGVAVATDRGLLVPVIRDVDRKNLVELSLELTEVSEKARERKLSLDDMQGGTFTISNLGGIGGTNFTPIVNSPEVAILGLDRGGYEPVYRDGAFQPRLVLPLVLGYDHRVIDGADGATFLRWIAEAFEAPLLAL